MLEKITEDRLSRFMVGMEVLSRVLAVAAIAGAILFIIGPALFTIWR